MPNRSLQLSNRFSQTISSFSPAKLTCFYFFLLRGGKEKKKSLIVDQITTIIPISIRIAIGELRDHSIRVRDMPSAQRDGIRSIRERSPTFLISNESTLSRFFFPNRKSMIRKVARGGR